MKMVKNKETGFTLFELLVSISIIGIMTAIAIVSYSAAQKKARDSRRIQDISTISKAAEQYYSQANYVYPAGVAIANWTVGGSAVVNAFPTDPKNVAPYQYTYVGGVTFCACAQLEGGAVGNSGNSTCTDYAGVSPKIYFCASNQQ